MSVLQNSLTAYHTYSYRLRPELLEASIDMCTYYMSINSELLQESEERKAPLLKL